MARLRVTRLLAAIFLVAALFHLAALIRPSIAEPDPAWRHALFVAINLAVAWALVVRPRGLLAGLGLLLGQQLWSHGHAALAHWRAEGRVDWASALVLVGLPLAFAAVYSELRRGSRAEQQ